MTTLLDQAYEAAQALPEAEQNRIAEMIQHEIQSARPALKGPNGRDAPYEVQSRNFGLKRDLADRELKDIAYGIDGGFEDEPIEGEA